MDPTAVAQDHALGDRADHVLDTCGQGLHHPELRELTDHLAVEGREAVGLNVVGDLRGGAGQRGTLLGEDHLVAQTTRDLAELGGLERQPDQGASHDPTNPAWRVTALASVREATWSTTIRTRSVSSEAARQSSAKGRSRASGPRSSRPSTSSTTQLALSLHQRHAVVGPHDVVGGDALEHGDLEPGLLGDDQAGVVAHERSGTRGEGGLLDAATEPADHVGGEVLEGGQGSSAAVVGTPGPGLDRHQPGQHLVEDVVGRVGEVPVADGLPDGGPVDPGQVDATGDDPVLDVVDGVGDVVGEVHHLGLQAARLARDSRPHPREHRQVVVIDAELDDGARGSVGVHAHRGLADSAGPGILGAGVERGPGQVEPDRASLGIDGLGLQPRQQSQGLGVALETTAALGQVGQRPLAVVAERWMAEVVGQRRRLDDVGMAAERPGQVAGDLGHLETVGEPVADEVVGLGADDLGLGGQPSRGRRMHDAGPVTLERGADRRLHPLGRLLHQPRTGGGVIEALRVIAVDDVHQPTTLQGDEDKPAVTASRTPRRCARPRHGWRRRSCRSPRTDGCGRCPG